MPGLILPVLVLLVFVAHGALSWVVNFQLPGKVLTWAKDGEGANKKTADVSLRSLVNGFQVGEYVPPLWARAPNLHTILGSGDFERRVFGDSLTPQLDYKRKRYLTGDGGFVDVDFLEPDPRASGEGRDDALVVVLHGLESSSTAPLTKKFCQAFARRGYRCAAVNFRGCSVNPETGEEEAAASQIQYHLGWTGDLHALMPQLRRDGLAGGEHGSWNRMFLSGFSCGANVVTKYLGEKGETALLEGVAGAAVGCVPFGLPELVEKMSSSLVNKRVYTPAFLNAMKAKALRHIALHGDGGLDVDAIINAPGFREFDDAYTAPVFGFRDSSEYYETACAKQDIANIRVPTLIMNAYDDPFTVMEVAPSEEDIGAAPVIVNYQRFGGHCAFVPARVRGNGRDKEGADGKQGEEDNNELALLQSSERFLPKELARFVEYLCTEESRQVIDNAVPPTQLKLRQVRETADVLVSKGKEATLGLQARLLESLGRLQTGDSSPSSSIG